MKNQVILQRLFKSIALPLVCFFPAAIGLWLVAWVLFFQWFGVKADFGPMPIEIWLAVFAGLAYFTAQGPFNLAMQTGVSRRYFFSALILVWVSCTVLVAAVLGIWSHFAPMPQLLIQDLGYRGALNGSVLIANALLVLLSLMVAALVGILVQVATMKVTPDSRWWLFVVLFVLLFWLVQSPKSAHATQWLAQLYWGWPAVLAVALAGLLGYLGHEFQVLEPRN